MKNYKVMTTSDLAGQRLEETLRVVREGKSQSKVEGWKKESERRRERRRRQNFQKKEEDPLKKFKELSENHEIHHEEESEDFAEGIESVYRGAEKNRRLERLDQRFKDRRILENMGVYTFDAFGEKSTKTKGKGAILKKLMLEPLSEEVNLDKEDLFE